MKTIFAILLFVLLNCGFVFGSSSQTDPKRTPYLVEVCFETQEILKAVEDVLASERNQDPFDSKNVGNTKVMVEPYSRLLYRHTRGLTYREIESDFYQPQKPAIDEVKSWIENIKRKSSFGDSLAKKLDSLDFANSDAYKKIVLSDALRNQSLKCRLMSAAIRVDDKILVVPYLFQKMTALNQMVLLLEILSEEAHLPKFAEVTQQNDVLDLFAILSIDLLYKDQTRAMNAEEFQGFLTSHSTVLLFSYPIETPKTMMWVFQIFDRYPSGVLRTVSVDAIGTIENKVAIDNGAAKLTLSKGSIIFHKQKIGTIRGSKYYYIQLIGVAKPNLILTETGDIDWACGTLEIPQYASTSPAWVQFSGGTKALRARAMLDLNTEPNLVIDFSFRHHQNLKHNPSTFRELVFTENGKLDVNQISTIYSYSLWDSTRHWFYTIQQLFDTGKVKVARIEGRLWGSDEENHLIQDGYDAKLVIGSEIEFHENHAIKRATVEEKNKLKINGVDVLVSGEVEFHENRSLKRITLAPQGQSFFATNSWEYSGQTYQPGEQIEFDFEGKVVFAVRK